MHIRAVVAQKAACSSSSVHLYHFVIAVWRAKEAEFVAVLSAKTAIQIIRGQFRGVREQGGSSVTAQSLEQLLDHLESGRAEKDIAALVDAEKEMALAKTAAISPSTARRRMLS